MVKGCWDQEIHIVLKYPLDNLLLFFLTFTSTEMQLAYSIV